MIIKIFAWLNLAVPRPDGCDRRRAGLAGLCLAQRLLREGVDVQAFEADAGPFVRRQGYRITVHDYGLNALQRSLPPTIAALALSTAGKPGGYFRFTNSHLRDAVKLSCKPKPDAPRQMDRQVLRSALLVGLDDRVHYGKAAVAVEPGRNGMRLWFADAMSVGASVVVGADGVGSALRSTVVPGAQPRNSGVGAIYGRTLLRRNDLQLVPSALEKSGVLAIGEHPGRTFFMTSMRFVEPPADTFARLAPGQPVAAADDYVMWAVSLTRDEMRAAEQVVNDPPELTLHAAHLTSEFHPALRDLVDAADREATVLTTFAVGQRPTAWVLPRATLIGDAVHVMPPFGGDGGNVALRDAAVLGDKLASAFAGETSVEAAVAAYQREMVPYAFKAVDASARMMRRLTASPRWQRWLLTSVLPRLHRVTVPDNERQRQ